MENSILKRREPYTFMLWLGIFGMGFLFFILTMMYLISKTSSMYWIDFKFPKIFWLSTLLILGSSYTIHQANLSMKEDKYNLYKLFLGITLVLGFLFIVSQLIGWMYLAESGILLSGSPSGAFLYVISGLHILHLFAGLFLLGVVLIEALRNRKYIDDFVYSVNPPNQLRIRLISIYWHFVDVLWIYLFLFFLFNHS